MNNPSTSSIPPRWIDRLLEWFCSEEFLEVVQGDLHEMYKRNVEEQGEKKANLLYLLDVLSLFRPFALGLNVPHFHLTTFGMYKSYLTTAFRNFRRQFGFSFINIFGLAIGMATFMIILTYVSYELSYDDYHPNKNQIFRWKTLPYKSPNGELWFDIATSMPAISSFIKDNMPEVQQVARLHHCPFLNLFITVTHIDKENNKKSFNEEHAYFADASFLSMIDIQMLAGSSASFHQPNTIILSESTARRYFGNDEDNIIGQVLQIPFLPTKLETQYTVIGIYQDLPPNTHFQMDMMLSYTTLSENDPNSFENNWLPLSIYIYLQLHPQVSEAQFLQKRGYYTQLINERHETEKTHNKLLWLEYELLPVDDIYLQSKSLYEIRPPGNAQTVYLLLGIGLLVIIIAWVNYVNLTTAKAVQRAKEVGVRKVAGANRGQLILQFLSEAFILNLLSILLAFFIIWLSFPFFRQLTGKPLSLHLWYQGVADQSLFFGVMILLFFSSTVLSGIYPAMVLSSYQPLKILRGRLLHLPSQGLSLRSGLVVFQFVISVVLIAGTYVMYRQVAYMQEQHLGFDTNQMLVIQSPSDDSLKSSTLEVFKNEVSAHTFVENTATSSTVPGRSVGWAEGIGFNPQELKHRTETISVDYDFLDLYGFTFIAGRKFSKAYGTDDRSIIINTSTAEMLGFIPAETAMHQRIYLEKDELEVIGVVQDFHQTTLKDAYIPISFILEHAYADDRDEVMKMVQKSHDRTFLSVKINTAHLGQSLESIEEKWKTHFPGFPFEYSFLDDRFNQQYQADIQFGNIFGIFASLAIIIACLGILGLSSYFALQKSKEIGIRKVLGATVTHIVLLLSSKFMRLVMVATLIALPLAYFLFDRWLENYAFRIEIGWWFFVIPALMVFMIAILTISAQTVKAALANPVNSLKYE